MITKIILLFILSFQAFAVGDEKIWPEEKPKNFCADPELAAKNEDLARSNPTDERLIKLVALRVGLCGLLDKNVITLESAIDVFNAEKDSQVMKRLQEVQTREHEINL
ncbi:MULTISPECIES: hypothetical protein [Methylomonas]|nr:MULTISPECIES: hypothetical protein [Methylomonas]TCV88555.1 hypothetical protein EDE11_101345 [Methylomonas methanica]